MEDLTKMSSQDLFARVTAIRMAMANGATSYKKAKEIAQPYLDALNERARFVASKFGRKPQRFDFAGLARNLVLIK